MKNKLQSWMANMGDGACLALCYIAGGWYLEHNSIPDNDFLLRVLLYATEDGLVDEDDGFVKDAVKLLDTALPRVYHTVEMRDVTEIPDELAAVRFNNKGFGHWVLCNQGKIIFDSLNDSQCVKYGKITTARIIRRK